MKELNYKAILTIHKLPEMSNKEMRQVRNWILKIHNQISVLNKSQYSKKMIFKLMK